MTSTRHAISLCDMARRSMDSSGLGNGLSGISMSFAEMEYRNTLQRLLDMTWAELHEHVSKLGIKSTDEQDLKTLMDNDVLPPNGIVRDLIHLVDIWPLLSFMASEAAEAVARRRTAADISEPLLRIRNRIIQSIRDDYLKPTAPRPGAVHRDILPPGSDMDSRLSRIEERIHALVDKCDSLEEQLARLSRSSQ